MRFTAASHNPTIAHLPLFCAAVLLMSCAGGQKSQWDNLDYSSVYRKAGEKQEYDTGYTPSYSGCVDDDLIGCE
ncbi:MAG: hypothetical protein AB7L92_05820 [Alphaproteobacteria bacterium]